MKKNNTHELKKGDYVISPVDDYLFTKGKKYRVLNVENKNLQYYVSILNDKGNLITVSLKQCRFIRYQDWIVQKSFNYDAILEVAAYIMVIVLLIKSFSKWVLIWDLIAGVLVYIIIIQIIKKLNKTFEK